MLSFRYEDHGRYPGAAFEERQAPRGRAGVTLSVLIEDALRQHLNTRPDTETPPFKLITVGGDGLVDPSIDLDKICELIARDDEEKYGQK